MRHSVHGLVFVAICYHPRSTPAATIEVHAQVSYRLTYLYDGAPDALEHVQAKPTGSHILTRVVYVNLFSAFFCPELSSNLPCYQPFVSGMVG